MPNSAPACLIVRFLQVSDIAMAPIKAMSMTLIDDQESQHKDGARKVISFMKSMGQIFGVRKGEDVSAKFFMNLESFVHSLRYEF